MVATITTNILPTATASFQELSVSVASRGRAGRRPFENTKNFDEDDVSI